ncbi:MAG: 1,4-dihydroxy-2-naphthoate octaprenyltransferase [Alphaproteobacteria bacterium]|nr:1,4-dihydroxy-2-naphthoate octaprenyltransferase [Alphaproteobacteria bacterium]MBF0250086.1 1,4-dihydroxy-2-naphthoate octaprenyltransferase [Alphaproteobacteria bacterium]
MKTGVPPTGAALWWWAARPRTLGLAFSPVVAATALAWAGPDPVRHPEAPVVAVLCAALTQAGSNLFNDAADFVNGTDRAERLGPPRATAEGWATPSQVSVAALTAFLLAALGGFYLTWIGGWPIYALGVAALFAGYAYSNGPWPVSRTPFGEVFVLFFFGLVAVGGAYYLQTGRIGQAALWWGMALGAQAAAVLLLNNVRDMDGDARAGRRTLAIVLGLAASRRVYATLMVLPYLIMIATSWAGLTPLGALAGLAGAPMAARTVAAFHGATPSPAMNALLAGTVKVQLVTALAAAMGLGLTAVMV